MTRDRPACVLLVALTVAACAAFGDGAAAAQETGLTGALVGTLRAPWSRDASGVVAVRVADTRIEPIEPNPVLDQTNFTFMPRLLPITVGTTVDFDNSDLVLHNVFSPSAGVKEFNLGTYARGITRTVTFERIGLVVVLCNVHPQMAAFILVLDTPYFTLADERGQFRLEGLPPGEHEVEFWAESADPLRHLVRIEAGGETRLDIEFETRRRGGWIVGRRD